MTEHTVRIALPATAVHQAWRRYVGYGGSEAEGSDLTWQSDDGSGLTATFIPEGDEATTLSTHRDLEADALPGLASETLSELVDGFVAYVNAAFDELDTEAGDRQGDAPVGPGGDSHLRAQPPLGTDQARRS